MNGRRRVTLAAVLVTVLAVTAGCGAVGVGERDVRYDVPARTTTDGAGDPGDGGTGVEGVGPDGTDGDGTDADGDGSTAEDSPVVTPGSDDTGNLSRLAEVHRATLRNRSFRVRLVHVVQFPNGTAREVRTTALLSTDRRRSVVVREVRGVDGSRSRIEYRDTGETVYRRNAGDGPAPDPYAVAGNGTGSRVDCSPMGLPDPTYHATVERAFRASNPTSVERTGGDRQLVRITAASEDPGRFDPGVADVRGLRVEAFLDPRGVVRSLRVNYRGISDGKPVSVTTTLSVLDVGSTAVTFRPDHEAGFRGIPIDDPDDCG